MKLHPELVPIGTYKWCVFLSVCARKYIQVTYLWWCFPFAWADSRHSMPTLAPRSLFEMTLANWPPVARLLMENVTDSRHQSWSKGRVISVTHGVALFYCLQPQTGCLIGVNIQNQSTSRKVMALPVSSSHLNQYMERFTLMFILRATNGTGSYPVALKTMFLVGAIIMGPRNLVTQPLIVIIITEFPPVKEPSEWQLHQFSGTEIITLGLLDLDMSFIWNITTYCWHISFEHANG